MQALMKSRTSVNLAALLTVSLVITLASTDSLPWSDCQERQNGTFCMGAYCKNHNPKECSLSYPAGRGCLKDKECTIWVVGKVHGWNQISWKLFYKAIISSYQYMAFFYVNNNEDTVTNRGDSYTVKAGILYITDNSSKFCINRRSTRDIPLCNSKLCGISFIRSDAVGEYRLVEWSTPEVLDCADGQPYYKARLVDEPLYAIINYQYGYKSDRQTLWKQIAEMRTPKDYLFSSPAKELAPWLIAVITIVVLAIVTILLITLICCLKKRRPERQDKKTFLTPPQDQSKAASKRKTNGQAKPVAPKDDIHDLPSLL